MNYFNSFLKRKKYDLLCEIIIRTTSGIKVRTHVFQDDQIQKEIACRLRANFKVLNFNIDVADFKDFLEKADYSRFRDYYDGGMGKNFVEKALEHYLSAVILNISKNDIFIDAACANSPVFEIYRELYSCDSYRQDILFSEGLQGNTIGGNACRMQVEDGFADKMTMHCSFEHFEQKDDIKFIKEASRVLKSGGKLCIVPLYLHNIYAIQTDPEVLLKNKISFEKDAVLYFAKNWKNRHGRFYDIPHLISRIKNNLSGFDMSIFIIQNNKEVDNSCYVKFMALLEKK